MIPLFKVAMSDAAANAAKEVLLSGYIGQGQKVEDFENDLRKYFNHDHIVTVNSATSGLHLGLRLSQDRFEKVYGFDDDTEVLTTALTCTATNWPILANGMKIRWVDVDPTTLNLDLDDLERKLSPKTRIIIIVHWGGYPVDLDRIAQIQTKYRQMYGFTPMVIQDCAHAFGSTYKGVHVGTYHNVSMMAVHSFQAIKHMTSVDGGAMILPSYLYKEAKLLRWYGIDRDTNKKDFRCEADVENWGYKFHMNDVNAAVGIENLKVSDAIVDRHKANGAFYNRELNNVGGVTLLKNEPGYDSAYWIYSMKVEDQAGFMAAMADRGISVSRVHERNDLHTTVAEYRSALPTLDGILKQMICIPSGWWVTDEDREYVVEQIKRGW